MAKKKLQALLTEKAEKYYNKLAYDLEPKRNSGHGASQSDVVNYVLETLADIEAVVGDPVIWLQEQKESKSNDQP
ncbi:hypothetical protein [Chitinophaga japonensis]|uniref:Uncharacterized protein n=1 Tax=Chitinophaga japonensis TaxID=104662 RepID=A0A562SYA5_CHIJA|nr:hypothetical protein [Chitinophaga japonensis]TWI86335.1 hypothetical protein LX66_3589 [Chitinophaga japonensis]